VQDGQPTPAERRQIELVGQPGRKAEDAGHSRMGRRRDRDRAAHREPDEERPLAACRLDRRERVLDTEVEPLPGLDAIAHLCEPDLGERGGEPADEPLDGRTPGSRHRCRLATVRADDTEGTKRARHSRLGPRRQPLRGRTRTHTETLDG